MSNSNNATKKVQRPFVTLKIEEWETPAAGWFDMNRVVYDMENMHKSSKGGGKNVHVPTYYRDDKDQIVDLHFDLPYSNISAVAALKSESDPTNIASFSAKYDYLKAGKGFYKPDEWGNEKHDVGFKNIRFWLEWEEHMRKFYRDNPNERAELAAQTNKPLSKIEGKSFDDAFSFESSVMYHMHDSEGPNRGLPDDTRSPVMPLKVWTGQRKRDQKGTLLENVNGILVPPKDEIVIYGEYRDFTQITNATQKGGARAETIKDYESFRKLLIYDKVADRGKHFMLNGRVEILSPSLYATQKVSNFMFKIKKMVVLAKIPILMGRKEPTPEEDDAEIRKFNEYKLAMARKGDQIATSLLTTDTAVGNNSPKRPDSGSPKRKADQITPDVPRAEDDDTQNHPSEPDDTEIQDDTFSVDDKSSENAHNATREKPAKAPNAPSPKSVPELTLVQDPKRQKLGPKNPLTG